MNESYHSQHSPLGAFASFTIGLVDSPGGFGHALRGPAKQNVFIGFRRGSDTWKILPFLHQTQSHISAFTGEAVHLDAPAKPPFETIRPEQYDRQLTWASDVWTSGEFSFGLRSPFSRIKEPTTLSEAEARFHFAPVVCGFISYDNSKGTEPVELVFGINELDVQVFAVGLPGSKNDLTGFVGAETFGFATRPSPQAALRQGFSLFEANPMDYTGLHLLGPQAGLVFTVGPGEKAEFPLSLAFYSAGRITTGLPTTYAYTRWFKDIFSVLRHGLTEHAHYTQVALERDAELAKTKLSDDQKFLIAQATHSYFGSSQLLDGPDGLIWNVNEGEYRMINTFDLTVDHVFFELEWHPWAVRNALDLFVSRYSYVDQVRTPEGSLGTGGLSFTHDMGVNNHFTPAERSSYECDNLTGCFSHMTMEQLLNWVLTAVTYAWQTKDTEWLRRNQGTLLRCVESMENRDHPEAAKRNGLLKCDSSRCVTGSEITTYDSLDVSLGQARNNLYLAVKALGAWILLSRAFDLLKDPANADRSRAAAGKVVAAVVERFEEDTGFFPAVFEKGNRSRILPAVEGLVYPLYLGFNDAFPSLQPLMERLRKHLTAALVPGVCIDEKSGGWKISSTSNNTWFSKIAIAQHVVRKLFPETLSAAAKNGDHVHARWQKTPGCGTSAMCDQIFSDTGVTCGSRYYPRGVTACLWMRE